MFSGRKHGVLGWPPVKLKENGSNLRTGRRRAAKKESVAMRRMKERALGEILGPQRKLRSLGFQGKWMGAKPSYLHIKGESQFTGSHRCWVYAQVTA